MPKSQTIKQLQKDNGVFWKQESELLNDHISRSTILDMAMFAFDCQQHQIDSAKSLEHKNALFENALSFEKLLEMAANRRAKIQQRVAKSKHSIQPDGQNIQGIIENWVSSKNLKSKSQKDLWSLFYEELQRLGFKGLKKKNNTSSLDKCAYHFVDAQKRTKSISHKRFKNIISSMK